MAYIGRGLSTGQYTKLDSISDSFNGSTTSFNLTRSSTTVTPSAQNLLISIDGIIQEPLVAFSVTGSVINFSTAPGDGATFFGIMMGDAAFIAGDSVAAGELGVTAGTAKASKAAVLGTGKDISDLGNVSGSSVSTGSFGKLLGDGADITGISAGISHDGSTVDGVLTYKDADEATVEANLTFDGTTLSVSGEVDGLYTALLLKNTQGGGSGQTRLEFRTEDENDSDDTRACFVAEDDGANSGKIAIQTRDGSGDVGDRMVIDKDGKLTVTGNIVPSGTTRDLGTSADPWRALYTGDLRLRNNRGDYFIEEEEEYL